LQCLNRLQVLSIGIHGSGKATVAIALRHHPNIAFFIKLLEFLEQLGVPVDHGTLPGELELTLFVLLEVLLGSKLLGLAIVFFEIEEAFEPDAYSLDGVVHLLVESSFLELFSSIWLNLSLKVLASLLSVLVELDATDEQADGHQAAHDT
jgi:hypothetical protein